MPKLSPAKKALIAHRQRVESEVRSFVFGTQGWRKDEAAHIGSEIIRLLPLVRAGTAKEYDAQWLTMAVGLWFINEAMEDRTVFEAKPVRVMRNLMEGIIDQVVEE